MKKKQEIVCDRDEELGCSIDMQAANPLKFKVVETLDSIKSSKMSGPVIKVGSELKRNKNVFTIGAELNPVVIRTGKHFSLPNFGFDFKTGIQTTEFPNYSLNGEVVKGPYKVSKSNSKLLFNGEIKEFKTNKLLGWFDENDFGVIEPCAYSWNKDSAAIEIIDEFGHVCFFIEYKNDTLDFRGYFRRENNYYIFNDKPYYTDDINEAEKLILDIPKVFDHYRKNLGKRL